MSTTHSHDSHSHGSHADGAHAPEADPHYGHAHGHSHDGQPHAGHGADTSKPGAAPLAAEPLANAANTLRVRVNGMDCSEEVAVVRAAVEPLPGVVGISADIAQGIVSIGVGVTGPTIDQLVAAIRRSGLGAEPAHAGSVVPRTLWQQRWREILTLIAGLAIGAGACLHGFQSGFSAVFADAHVPWIAQTFYGLAILITVGPLLPRAWGAVRGLRLDMNVLMVIAVCGAVTLGDWFEAATVGTLFALSLVLESWTARRAGQAIADLLRSAPQRARLAATADAPEREVPVAEVTVGALVIVKPGETIPVDGRIRAGASSINQAPITGESVPVTKASGAEVFAGCVNGEGALEIEATQTVGDTMLARIARLVAESQQRRGGTERWIDRFARIYTPVVLAIAVAVTVLPGALTGHWSYWFYQALILLVIACPCALVISVPVCIVAGIASAARTGIIVRGGEALEVAARLRTIAFDKTGTLTVGRPAVTQVFAASGITPEEVLAVAAGIEARSEHPVAHAVLEHARQKGIKPTPVNDVTAVPGKGIQTANGTWAGSLAWARERNGMDGELLKQLDTELNAGSTMIVVGRSDQVLGGIACRDQVRPETTAALAGVRRLGIQRLIMLSGDADVVAQRVASGLGLTEAYGGLLPDAKVAKIGTLAQEAGPLAMVGDGLNDAPALARANLGVAMGSATAATLETADVALLNNDLRSLPWLITHARHTMTIMRQNVIASFATKAVFVVLAIVGLGSMWIAIAADTGVSLLVVLNGMRLLRIRSQISSI